MRIAEAGRDRAEHRTDAVDDEAGQEAPLAAVAVGELAAGDHQGRHHQQEQGDRDLHALDGGVQVGADVVDHHVHVGAGEAADELCQRQRHEHAPKTVAPGALNPCVHGVICSSRGPAEPAPLPTASRPPLGPVSPVAGEVSGSVSARAETGKAFGWRSCRAGCGASLTEVSEPDPPTPPGSDANRRMPGMLEPEETSPAQRVIRVTLTLLLLYLIFGVLIPSFASYEDVWDALTSLNPVALLFLAALTVVVEGCKAGAFALMIEPLRLTDAFLAQEAAAVVSNTVPGPSGTAARYVTYRKLGITTEDFATSYVVNSSVSNVLPLVMPVIGLALLSTQSEVPGSVWTLALIGLGVSVALLVLVVLIMRSEDFARRLERAWGDSSTGSAGWRADHRGRGSATPW